jgi:Uma2 family endonuclease
MVAQPAPNDRLWTADELLALPDDGYHRYELVRGRLVCMAPAASKSAIVGGRIAARLGSYVDAHHLGVYGNADWGYRLASDPDVVRAPDVGFVRAEHVPAEGIPPGFWPGAPDLAVEVLSPSDRFAAVIAKVQDYLAAGTRLVWALDPEARTAVVFRPGVPALVLDEGGVLDGGEVVPGFTLRLADVWV